MNIFRLFDIVASLIIWADQVFVTKILRPLIKSIEWRFGFTPAFVTVVIMHFSAVLTFKSFTGTCLKIYEMNDTESAVRAFNICIVLLVFKMMYCYFIAKLAHYRQVLYMEDRLILNKHGLAPDLSEKVLWLLCLPFFIAAQFDPMPALPKFITMNLSQVVPFTLFYLGFCVASIPSCHAPREKRTREGKVVFTILYGMIILVLDLLYTRMLNFIWENGRETIAYLLTLIFSFIITKESASWFAIRQCLHTDRRNDDSDW